MTGDEMSNEEQYGKEIAFDSKVRMDEKCRNLTHSQL